MCEWRIDERGDDRLAGQIDAAAPGGACTSPRRPTRVNRAFSTRKAEFSIGALPSPAMRRAPSYSVAREAAPGACATGRASVTEREETRDDDCRTAHADWVRLYVRDRSGLETHTTS